NHFELREYDPVIGRWIATDPYGQYWSPYIGMGNNPVDGIDADGGFKTRFGAWVYRTVNGGGEIYNDGDQWVVGMAHTIKYGRDGSPTYWTNSVSNWGNGVGGSFMNGFAAGAHDTWEGIKHQFTW